MISKFALIIILFPILIFTYEKFETNILLYSDTQTYYKKYIDKYFSNQPGLKKILYDSERIDILTGQDKYLDIYTSHKQEKSVTRYVLTPNEFNLFIRIKDDIRKYDYIDHSGRLFYMVTNFINTLTFSGWALPYVLNFTGKSYWGMYMLAQGGSFYANWKFTETRDITYSHAVTNFVLSVNGMIQGLYWGNAILGFPEEYEYDNVREKTDDRIKTGLSFLGTTAGVIGAYNLVEKIHINTGRALMINTGFISGYFLGGMLKGILNDTREQGYFQYAAPLSDIGAIAGYFYRKDKIYSSGSVLSINGFSFVSTYSLFAIQNLCGLWSDISTESYSTKIRINMSVLSLGYLGSIYLGDKLIDSYDFTFGQGLLINFGMTAGYFTGLGISYLIDELANERLMFTRTAITSAAGLYLTYIAFKDSAKKKELLSNNNVYFYPQNILLSSINRKSIDEVIPFLYIRY